MVPVVVEEQKLKREESMNYRGAEEVERNVETSLLENTLSGRVLQDIFYRREYGNTRQEDPIKKDHEQY